MSMFIKHFYQKYEPENHIKPSGYYLFNVCGRHCYILVLSPLDRICFLKLHLLLFAYKRRFTTYNFYGLLLQFANKVNF